MRLWQLCLSYKAQSIVRLSGISSARGQRSHISLPQLDLGRTKNNYSIKDGCIWAFIPQSTSYAFKHLSYLPNRTSSPRLLYNSNNSYPWTPSRTSSSKPSNPPNLSKKFLTSQSRRNTRGGSHPTASSRSLTFPTLQNHLVVSVPSFSSEVNQLMSLCQNSITFNQQQPQFLTYTAYILFDFTG